MDNVYVSMSGREAELNRASEHVAHLRQSARRLAKDAGFGLWSAEERAGGRTPTVSAAELDVNKDGGARCKQVQVK